MKLIKLQDKFILVSDEEIKKDDYYVAWETNYETEPKERWVVYNLGSRLNGINQKKIIAGIPELPSIDFSLLSEKDCKTIGWVDVKKLTTDYIKKRYSTMGNSQYFDEAECKRVFKDTFKTAQSLNDKMFSLEDMNAAIAFGFGICRKQDRAPFNKEIISFIQSLQQTSWDVEVEMQPTEQFDEATSIRVYVPKITNNSVKITKII